MAVKNLSEIDWKHLQQNVGVKCIILDKDNTITAPYVDSQVHLAENFVLELLNTFGDTNVAILSNSAGTLDDAPKYSQAEMVQKTTGIAVIPCHDEKKPGGIEEGAVPFQPACRHRVS